MSNQLIIDIKNNNEKVIADVYKKYRNEFLGFAYKRYNISIDQAKEIYQEAFTAMYRNIKEGRLSSLSAGLRTYLFRIGINLISNEFRRKKRIDGSVDASSMDVPDTEVSESSGKLQQIKDFIKKALDEVTDNCKKLLSLFYIENKKYEEIMLLLDYSSLDSVKTQKYKCFKKIETLVKSRYSINDIL